MKRILAIALLFFSTAAFAQDCDLTGFGSGLTDAQKQSLRVTCEEMVAESLAAPLAALEQADLSNPEAISAWGTVARRHRATWRHRCVRTRASGHRRRRPPSTVRASAQALRPSD